jgi:erythrocyte band 7 integral membrane protein
LSLAHSRDVRLPYHLQRAMAAEAEALREARAKLIAAEGEFKASRALREAADVIGESPAAIHLRYLQVMHPTKRESATPSVLTLRFGPFFPDSRFGIG